MGVGYAIQDLALPGPQDECVMAKPDPVSLRLKESIEAKLIALWCYINLAQKPQVEA